MVRDIHGFWTKNGPEQMGFVCLLGGVSVLSPEAPLACSAISNNLILTFRNDSMTNLG
jgi:hypothetical protein